MTSSCSRIDDSLPPVGHLRRHHRYHRNHFLTAGAVVGTARIVLSARTAYWQPPFQLRGRRSKMVAAGDSKAYLPITHRRQASLPPPRGHHNLCHKTSTRNPPDVQLCLRLCDPNHKLNTRVDTADDQTQLNDKARVRASTTRFLRSDTSAVTIDIIATTSYGGSRCRYCPHCAVGAEPRRRRPVVRLALSPAPKIAPPAGTSSIVEPNISRVEPSLTGNSKVNESDDGLRRSVEPELERKRFCGGGAEDGGDEAEVLESKLEKWRTIYRRRRNMNQKKHRRSLTLPSCFLWRR
ncbi:uncharacterized protein A4U43_C01F7680 [Asparagus officinalis]|uniref:Uncharacterized protein n=1 Tax=Asparagus officinalis TaxID=4686 RepID=A0A5P1FMP6_ASPOF|nr:uncharacterized protein A4U43_C01F7680 [Asparagus officinalis]